MVRVTDMRFALHIAQDIPSLQAVCDISIPWRLRNHGELQTNRPSLTVYKCVNFKAVCCGCTKEMNTAVYTYSVNRVNVRTVAAGLLNVNITAQD